MYVCNWEELNGISVYDIELSLLRCLFDHLLIIILVYFGIYFIFSLHNYLSHFLLILFQFSMLRIHT